MTTTPMIDEAKVEALAERAIGDLGGAMTTLFCALGDRLGLFKALAELGPTGGASLADHCGLQKRYVREWLHGMVAACLEYAPGPDRYILPTERVPVLAQESARSSGVSHAEAALRGPQPTVGLPASSRYRGKPCGSRPGTSTR
jgi:hypothetical protein